MGANQFLHTAGRSAAWISICVIGLAGVLKIVDVEQFYHGLQTWSLFPRWTLVPLAILVPTLELTVAAGWIVSHQRVWLYVGFWLVMSMTIAFVVQVSHAQMPSCACFGVLDQQFKSMSDLPVVVGRNVCLMSALIVGWAAYGAGSASGAPRVSRPRQSGRRESAGFSMVEVVVVMAVLAVLVTLLLFGLRQVRASRDGALSLSNLHQHGTVFAQYGQEHRDAFPYQGYPALAKMSFPIGQRQVTVEYFHAYSYWGFALAEHYYSGDVWHHSFYSPDMPADPRRGRRIGVPSYGYPCVFLAHADYWNPRTRVRSTGQLGATTHSSVTFPASKLLLINTFSAERQFVGVGRRTSTISTDMLLCDGSARLVRLDEQAPGVEDAEGPVPGATHAQDGPFAFHTLDGVRGRDLGR